MTAAEEATRRLEAMSAMLATIAKGLAAEEQAGTAAGADHTADDRSLDRLSRLTRLMGDIAAEEKLLRLAIDGMATCRDKGGVGRRPTRSRKPNSRYPAADWTSSSSTSGPDESSNPRRASTSS